MEEIVLGGGCFWCIEGAIIGLKGVIEVTPGYSGGHVESPTYEQVCGKKTGHAEVVKVVFDPNLIPRRKLLEFFFTLFDPTQLNRQGNDIGPQYRSAIFFEDENQRIESLAVIREISENFESPVVTEVEPLENFWPAEDYHHNYFARNGDSNPYCVAVVGPKISKARSRFSDLYD